MNNFGYTCSFFKTFLSIHVALSLSEVAKKYLNYQDSKQVIRIKKNYQASDIKQQRPSIVRSCWYMWGKRVILEILNVKGLNLSSLLATPDVFKLQVQHCRYHSLHRNIIKLLYTKAWGKLTDERLSSPAATIRVLQSSGQVNNLDLLRSFCVGPPTHWLTAWQVQRLASENNMIVEHEFVIIAKPNTCTGSFSLHCWLVVPAYSTRIQTKLSGRVWEQWWVTFLFSYLYSFNPYHQLIWFHTNSCNTT